MKCIRYVHICTHTAWMIQKKGTTSERVQYLLSYIKTESQPVSQLTRQCESIDACVRLMFLFRYGSKNWDTCMHTLFCPYAFDLNTYISSKRALRIQRIYQKRKINMTFSAGMNPNFYCLLLIISTLHLISSIKNQNNLVCKHSIVRDSALNIIYRVEMKEIPFTRFYTRAA